MSQESVEIVRGAFARLEVDDAALLTDEALEQYFDPDVEWLPVPQGVLGGGKGYEGIRRFWTDWIAPWDELRFEPDEFRDLGERVLVVARLTGRTRGVEVDEVWSSLWTLRDRRILRFQAFTSREEGLKAVGLDE